MTENEQIEIFKEMIKKKPDEINAMFNSGMFNDIVLGALVITLENLASSNNWNKNDINEIVYECKTGTFDQYTAGQMRDAYKNI